MVGQEEIVDAVKIGHIVEDLQAFDHASNAISASRIAKLNHSRGHSCLGRFKTIPADFGSDRIRPEPHVRLEPCEIVVFDLRFKSIGPHANPGIIGRVAALHVCIPGGMAARQMLS